MTDIDLDIRTKLEQLAPGHEQHLECAARAKRIFRGPKILTTDSSFHLAGVSCEDTPVLVDAYGDIILEPTLWLVYIRTMSTKRGSVLQYASALCSYWRHLQQVARKPWMKVNDALLQDWRNRMLAGVERKNLEKRKRTFNKKLYVILDFYRWCQEQGYVQGIIGLTPEGEQPYPIRLIEVIYKQQRRITSPLILKTRKPPLLPVPTNEEIDLLYIQLSGSNPVHERNVLLTKWALDSGMRESEVLDRVVSDLPTIAECQRLKNAGRLYWMEIVGKGDSSREVPISPDVLLETHSFIAGIPGYPSGRERMLAPRKSNTREDKIFLSATTGKPLNRQSVSHIFSNAFLLVTGRGDRRGLHYHRLRARFASKLVQELGIQVLEKGRSIHDSAEQQLILERAMGVLGHQDIKSLRYYLNALLDREDMATAAAAAKSRRDPTPKR